MKKISIIILGIIIITCIGYVHTANAFVLEPFGGRLLYFQIPIVSGVINCPMLAVVLNFGGPQKGLLFLMLPPSMPKAFYNFYTPGVAVLGNYVPVAVPFNCPLAPIYHSVIFGTSVR